MRLRSRALLAIALLPVVAVPAGPVPATAAQRSTLVFRDINPDFGFELSGIAGAQDPCSDCPGGGSGGRVNGMEIVADQPWVVYAASELGGLFKSENHGSSWSHVDGHLPTKMRDVEVGLTTGLGRGRVETIYATSRDDFRTVMHSGIQISRDRGATWTRAALGAPPTSCVRGDRLEGFEISVRPDSQRQVFVGTTCGIAYSNDAGVTWQFIDPAPDTTSGGQAIYSVQVLEGGQAWACGDEGVMASPNGVDYWARVTSPGGISGFCSIAVSPYEGYNVFLAVGASHYETIDGGQTWSAFAAVDPGGAKNREPFVRTNPMGFLSDAGGGSFQVWLGDGNLWRADCVAGTAFGGSLRCPHSRSSWAGTFTDGNGEQTKAHGDGATVEFWPSEFAGACPAFYSSDGGVYANRAMTDCHDPDFQDANVGLHAQWLWGMSGWDDPTSIRQDIVMGLQDNGIFATSNAHVDAPDWRHPIGGDAFDTATDGNTTFVSLYATDANRNAIGSLTRGGAGYLSPQTTNKPDDRWISQFRVPEAIDSWAPGNFVMAAMTQGGTGGASQAGLYTTDQPGATPIPWTRIGPSWPAGALEPCAVHTSVRNGVPYFYVMAGTCFGYNLNQVWLLEPGATQWKRIDTQAGGQGIGIFEADPTDPERLFASIWTGTEWRMMRTTKERTVGGPWIQDTAVQEILDRGLFRVLPTLIAVDPRDPRIMVAGGEESGVFVSSDGGKAWAPLTNTETPHAGRPHLPRPSFAVFDHTSAGLDSIYIGTQGRGVWRIGPPHTDLSLEIKLVRVVCHFSCEQEVCLSCPISPAEKLKLLIQPVNLGPAAGPSPVVRGVLPSGLRFRSIRAPSNWSCRTPAIGSPGAFSCMADEMPAGQAAAAAEEPFDFEVELDVAPDADVGSMMTMPVTLASAAIDTAIADNAVEFSNPVMPLADLMLSGNVSPSQGYVGKEAAFRIDVVQGGPDTAQDVRIDASLPAAADLVSIVPSLGSCTPTGSQWSCLLGTMAPGERAAIWVRAIPRVPGTVAVGAFAFAAQEDPYPSSNALSIPYVALGDATGPALTIVRPGRGLYLFDAPVVANSSLPVIAVGSIGVVAQTSDAESGIYSVGFTVDGTPVDPERVSHDAISGRFSFTFGGAPGMHTIVAYAINGGFVRTERTVDVLMLTVPDG